MFPVQNLLPFSLSSKNIKIKIHRNVILLIVLFGCETWSFALRDQRRLRVFEKMVLRIIFGPKRDEMIREWRKLHNEELSDLYSSRNIIRVIRSRIRWAGHVADMVDRTSEYSVLVGSPKEGVTRKTST